MPDRSLGQRFQGIFEFHSVESKRARPALVDNPSVAIDQVDSIRPASVGLLGLIVQAVDNGREFQSKSSHAALSDGFALAGILGAAEHDVLAYVALHLPDIAGMGFKNIDRKERNFPSIHIPQPVQRGSLPPKWRSSVTAEDEYHRLLAAKGRELNAAALVIELKIKIGCGVPRLKLPSPCLRPHGFEGQHQIYRWRHLRHDAAEGLGRPAHGPAHEG